MSGRVVRLDEHPRYRGPRPEDEPQRRAEAILAVMKMPSRRFAAVERLLTTVPTPEIEAWLDARHDTSPTCPPSPPFPA